MDEVTEPATVDARFLGANARDLVVAVFPKLLDRFRADSPQVSFFSERHEVVHYDSDAIDLFREEDLVRMRVPSSTEVFGKDILNQKRHSLRRGNSGYWREALTYIHSMIEKGVASLVHVAHFLDKLRSVPVETSLLFIMRPDRGSGGREFPIRAITTLFLSSIDSGQYSAVPI